MDFTAIDFETANSARTSICAVGIVRVENGEVVKSMHKLIRPDSPFSHFNTAIHGIDAFDVRNAPRFPDFWDEMRPLLTDTVIAHNAAFDISCLKASIEFYGLETPSFEYLCTLCISRKICKLPSHKLDALVRHYGLASFRHHNALEDALACARLFNIFSARADFSDMRKGFGNVAFKKPACAKGKTPAINNASAFAAKRTAAPRTDFPEKLNIIGAPQIFPSEASGNYREFPQAQTRKVYVKMEDNIPPPPEIILDDSYFACAAKPKAPQPTPQRDLVFDYSPIDFSKNFAVTGKFATLARGEVEGLILYRGGNVHKNVKENTDYIIVGSRRSPSWKYGEYGEKIDAALSYGRASFITEDHFLKEV